MRSWLSTPRWGIHWQQELWYWLLDFYGPVPREEECGWDAIERGWLQLQAWPGDRGWKLRNMGVKYSKSLDQLTILWSGMWGAIPSDHVPSSAGSDQTAWYPVLSFTPGCRITKASWKRALGTTQFKPLLKPGDGCSGWCPAGFWLPQQWRLHQLWAISLLTTLILDRLTGFLYI